MTDTRATDLHRLGDELTARQDGKGNIALYDSNPPVDEPEAKLVLDAGAMWDLIEYYLDGYCHICGDLVPQHHALCHSCADSEAQKWEGH